LDPDSKSTVPGKVLDVGAADAAYYSKDVSRSWPAGAADYIKRLNEQAEQDPALEKEALKEYLDLMDEYKDEDLDIGHILGAINDVKKKYGV
jgi:hypothetical protein